jgi:hypothetical protein
VAGRGPAIPDEQLTGSRGQGDGVCRWRDPRVGRRDGKTALDRAIRRDAGHIPSLLELQCFTRPAPRRGEDLRRARLSQQARLPGVQDRPGAVGIALRPISSSTASPHRLSWTAWSTSAATST